jgi:hypothetical protein
MRSTPNDTTSATVAGMSGSKRPPVSPADEQCRPAFLDHCETFALEVVVAGRRQVNLHTGGEHDLAVLPRIGVIRPFVGELEALHAVLPAHEDVERKIHHERHVDGVDRGQLDGHPRSHRTRPA